MLPPPSLLARGPVLATLVGLGVIALHGSFWLNAQETKVKCRGEDATVALCAAALFSTVFTALLCVEAINFFAVAIVLPMPKIRRAGDVSHHWLSPEFAHMGYTQPDERGYHHLLYLNHPTTPSKVRFNMADPGIHASELATRDLEDLSSWPTRQQGVDEDWFVDISRDDEMPPQYNDFTKSDAVSFADILTTHIIDYFATNNVNGSCFLTQYRSSGRSLRQGIIKVVPSTTGNGGENFPALECGTDQLAFNINIPLY